MIMATESKECDLRTVFPVHLTAMRRALILLDFCPPSLASRKRVKKVMAIWVFPPFIAHTF